MSTGTDDRWLRLALGVLEMSAGALTLTTPSRQAIAAFAELARGLADRAPAWLRPWPTLELDGDASDRPLAAVGIERSGHRLRLRPRPGYDGLEPRLVIEYYLHLVHDHWLACRVAARRPAGVSRLPAEEARLAEAFEQVEPVLAGAVGFDRLRDLWEALAAPV